MRARSRAWSSRAGEDSEMLMNEPIGDMLTRIRNAQMRKRPTVTTPASTLRARVLDVLQSEGYIRGYSETELNGKTELQIELKYFDGQPVIRQIQRGTTRGGPGSAAGPPAQ